MESTGQYWRPLWNLLEGEFDRLVLVNPQHIKGLNGYKMIFKGSKKFGPDRGPSPLRPLYAYAKHFLTKDAVIRLPTERG
jgi:hypothetical protein